MSKGECVANNELTIIWKESLTEGRALCSVFPTKYYSSEQMENGRGGAGYLACVRERRIPNFLKFFMLYEIS
jgi:hypothetical protein